MKSSWIKGDDMILEMDSIDAFRAKEKGEGGRVLTAEFKCEELLEIKFKYRRGSYDKLELAS